MRFINLSILSASSFLVTLLFGNIASARDASSFTQTCKNPSVVENVLIASCTRSDGSNHKTPILLRGIYNDDGVLRDSGTNKPASFQLSCREIRVIDQTNLLSAGCSTKNHSTIYSLITIDGISNYDGNLIYAQPPEEGRFLYSYNYPLSYGSNIPIKGNAADVFQELHRCFNCSFPISGAPAAYPVSGQHISLEACVLRFICKAAPVKAYPHDDLGYLQLVAEPGHFDGEGSTVTFLFYKDTQGNLNLNVTAYVTNTTLPDKSNRPFAKKAWGNFADTLAEYLYFSKHPL